MLLVTVITVSAPSSAAPGPAEANVAGGPGCHRPDRPHFLESTGLKDINSYGYQQCGTHNLRDNREDLRAQIHYLDLTFDCLPHSHTPSPLYSK